MNRRKKFNIGIVAAIGGIFLTAMTAVGCNSSSSGNPKSECPKAGELEVCYIYSHGGDSSVNQWIEEHPDVKIYDIQIGCDSGTVVATIIYYK